jgi:putative endonuclease
MRHPERSRCSGGAKDLARRGTMMSKRFFVYIMTNGPRRHALYTGITGNIIRRVFEHKRKLIPGFTSRYNLTHLVYFELFVYPDAAIAREKELKGWLRRRKIELIESLNPHWHDLAAHWYDTYRPPNKNPAAPRQILRSA